MKIHNTSHQKTDSVKVKIIKVVSIGIGTSITSSLLYFLPFKACNVLDVGILPWCWMTGPIIVIIGGGVITAFLIKETFLGKIFYGVLTWVVAIFLIRPVELLLLSLIEVFCNCRI